MPNIPQTEYEKAEAYDAIIKLMINQYRDGRYGFVLPSPGGGATWPTREEAIQDLIAYAERVGPQVQAKIERLNNELRALSSDHGVVSAGVPGSVRGMVPLPQVAPG